MKENNKKLVKKEGLSLYKILLIALIMIMFPFVACSKENQAFAEISTDATKKSESPWVNSNILGRAALFEKPSERDDFYLAANYEWLKNAKLKPGRAANGAFTELQYELDANLRALMTDKDLKGHDADLVRNLYSLWLDWDERNKNGLGKLKTHVDAVAKIKNINELSEYFKSDECKFYGALIANFGLGYDNDEPDFYNIEISATGLSLGDAAEYKKLTANGERVKKMSDGIALYMLKRLNYNDDEAKKILARAYEFEEKISSSMMSLEELESPEALKKLYTNKITLEKLHELSPVFPFSEILESYKIFPERMNLQQPKWLEALNEIYNENELENIKSYLIRNIASSAITRIDEDAFREYQSLSRERLGIKESAPDNEIAGDFVHGNLLTPLSKIYVEKFISPKTKQDVTNIINDTIEYYREMLKGETWLSEKTREKAIEKLEAITPRVAYPDKWRDYSKLDIKAKDDGETLENALEKLNKFGWENFYSKLNTKVDREMWGDDDIIIVNSYYSPSMNEIFIIAGILSGDFYGEDRSYEENLGSIGMVIGHELSHAFDTRGAQFDKDGTIKDWWTEEDYKKFQTRADRLIKYLGGLKVTPEGGFYNGSLVQTETIADMAGIKAMLGIAEKHKNFDYDKFFRAYARIWANVMTPARLDYLLKTNVHALPYIRVNAVVQQYEEFYKTYGITSSDAMYLAPENRVAVW